MSFWKKFFGTPQYLPNENKPQFAHADETSISDSENLEIGNVEENNETHESELENSEKLEENLEVEPSAQEKEPEPEPEPEKEVDGTTLLNEHSVDSKLDLAGRVTNTASELKVEEIEVEKESLAEQSTPETMLETPLSDEERLEKELKEAEAAALAAQLEAERQEVFEDLSVLDGRILPQLKVPDWRQELEFVKERYEPCDLSDHIVKVSKRRLTARQIDHELAESRLNAYERYLDRASRRFKDKIDEDALLNKVKEDLAQWRSEQAKSVAWVLADRVNEEVVKAKQAEIDATSFVEKNAEFTNPKAIEDYRHFARRIFLIPLTTMYIMSVIALTYSRFEWIMKFLPLFNLGLAKFQYMVLGVASYFLLANFWRYSKKVARIQKKLIAFNSSYQEQELKIKHAVKEHTRLSQQQPLLEPILRVLARGYRVQLQSDVMAKVHATTEFDTKTLPACVTLARADDAEESKMARLKQRALAVLMTPGWRTRGLNDIARTHAETRMLDASALSLSTLDTDSMVSATNAQRMLLEAFDDTSIHERVSKKRLVRAIEEIHKEVLANFSSEDRPRVISLRENGFNKIAFRTSWLADNDNSEEWIPFMTEILTDETSPFGLFNIEDRRSSLAKIEEIKSIAVVPRYFNLPDSKLKKEKPLTSEVMPLDIAVRVDVSPWADPSAFAVFANDTNKSQNYTPTFETSDEAPRGGLTGA